MVLPGIFAAQYPGQRRLLKWVVLGSVLLVPLGVYGGFFFGVVDLNLFSGMVGKGVLPLEDRLAVCPPSRYLSLFFHYVIPRYLALIIIELLLFGIGKRNAEMTAKQVELVNKASAEMRKRNDLQGMVIEKLSSVIESRDENTGEHVVRTKNYVGILAREMAKDVVFRDQLNEELIVEIESAAPLHDIGKIAVPDAILLKPGKLTPEEFDIIKEHTTKGGAMIRTLFSEMEDTVFLRLAEEITVSHHEWWDGSGYPKGLCGSDIPLAARIMAVADVYDALVTDRVYRKAMRREDALDIIYHESGTHFDPDIIRILKGIVESG
ncbi:MAG: HD domain-containing protein [Clostridia bacterium]|nr:HD domain-containing protein [Clostridia bacterium]